MVFVLFLILVYSATVIYNVSITGLIMPCCLVPAHYKSVRTAAHRGCASGVRSLFNPRDSSPSIVESRGYTVQIRSLPRTSKLLLQRPIIKGCVIDG
jgi:hypothetical protein